MQRMFFKTDLYLHLYLYLCLVGRSLRRGVGQGGSGYFDVVGSRGWGKAGHGILTYLSSWDGARGVTAF